MSDNFNSKLKVYISGFMSGFKAGGVREHFQQRADIVYEQDMVPLTPGAELAHLKSDETIAVYSGLRTGLSFFRKDRWMVEHSDIVWADFSPNAEVRSIGCTFELAWAAENPNCLVIVSGVPSGSAMDHGFVHAAADYWCSDYDEVRAALMQIKDEMGFARPSMRLMQNIRL